MFHGQPTFVVFCLRRRLRLLFQSVCLSLQLGLIEPEKNDLAPDQIRPSARPPRPSCGRSFLLSIQSGDYVVTDGHWVDMAVHMIACNVLGQKVFSDGRPCFGSERE